MSQSDDIENVEGMIRLVGAAVRLAILDGKPEHRRSRQITSRDQREAQAFVRDALKNQPKLLAEVESWWRNPLAPNPVRADSGERGGAEAKGE